MNLKHILVAAIVAAPIAVLAQTAPKPAAQTPKASLAAMQVNVVRITDPSEKERWTANLAMWQMKIDHTGAWTPEDVARMQASLDTIKTNVAQISGTAEAAEKERWQANRDLWEMYLEQVGKIPKAADLDEMNASFNIMKANVAKITNAAEKVRWQANRILWQSVLDQK